MKDKILDFSQISLYNTQHVTDEQSRLLFVARNKLLKLLLNSIVSTHKNAPPKHQLIIGQRGMGKTTLLKRIEVELRTQSDYMGFVPLLFPEEQYNLDSITTFWLNCIDALADMMEKEGRTEYACEIDQEVERLTSLPLETREKRVAAYFKHIAFNLGRRPVLLIDNINLVLERLKPEEQHALRSYLTEDGAAIVIGASSSQIDEINTYNAPFYDAFQVHYLRKLTGQELTDILNNLAIVTGKSNLRKAIRRNSSRLRAINQLTGGNPRTAVILFRQIINGFSNDITKELDGILDAQTPLYKARFEELPEKMQIIVNAIAMQWDPVTLEQIRESTQMENGQISPQLKRLSDFGWIEKPKSARGKGGSYEISERMFNIWFLMRRSSRRQKKRVTCLSKYMEAFYEKGVGLSAPLAQIMLTQFTDEKHALTALALAKLTEDKDIRWSLHEKTRRFIMDHPELSDTFDFKDLYDGAEEHVKALNNALAQNDSRAVIYHATPIFVAGINSVAPFLAQALIDIQDYTKAYNTITSIECGEEKYNLLIDLIVSIHDNDTYTSQLIEASCKEAIGCGAFNSDAYYYYSKFLVENNRLSEALDIIARAESVFPGDQRLRFAKGEAYYFLGDYQKSEEFFTSDEEQTSGENCFFLGLIKFNQQKYREAEEFFRNSLQDDTSIAFVTTIWIVLSLVMDGRTDEAQNLLFSSFDENDNPEAGARILSELLTQKKKFETLSDYLQKMVDFWPENLYLKYCLAESYYFQEEYSEAKELLDTYLLERPDDADAVYLRGIIAWQADDNYDFAINYIQKSAELESTAGKYNILGLLLRLRKDYKSSARFYEKSISIDSNNVSSLIALSELYEYHLGNIEKALHYAEKAYSVRPNTSAYRLINLYRDGLHDYKLAESTLNALAKEDRSFEWDAVHSILMDVYTNNLENAKNEFQVLAKQFETDRIQQDVRYYLYAKCIENGFGPLLMEVLDSIGFKESSSPEYYAIPAILSGDSSAFFDTLAKEFREIGLFIVTEIQYYLTTN